MEEGIIKLVSFNLKRDFGIPLKRDHRWRERRELAARLIRESGASVVGVQELSPSMREDVTGLLEDCYSVLGFGRFSGQKRQKEDEHSDIIVKNDDASVQLVKTFWLSKNPEKLSRAYYAMFPRICTVAEIYLNSVGRSIRVFNTHLDHVCGVARVLGVEVILQYMSRFNQERPMPTVLMGDLNCKPHSRPIQILRSHVTGYSAMHLTDAYSALPATEIQNTLHNFSGKVKSGAMPIDYIFLSDDFEILETRILTEPIDGHYPSDHYPLMTTVRLKPPPEVGPDSAPAVESQDERIFND